MGQPTKPLTSSVPATKSLFEHVKVEHMVAGFSGGVASTLILHPLDLLKIRFAGKKIHISILFCFNYNVYLPFQLMMEEMLYQVTLDWEMLLLQYLDKKE